MDLTGIILGSVFWVFIAFCVFIAAWKHKKMETLRQETARLLIEKNPTIDSDMLAQLLNPLTPSIKTGTAFRMMRAIGTIVVSVGLGLWIMGFWFAFGSGDRDFITALGGPASLVAVIGAGIIFAARFMPRPPAKDAETEMPKSSKNGLDL